MKNGREVLALVEITSSWDEGTFYKHTHNMQFRLAKSCEKAQNDLKGNEESGGW